MIIVFIFLFVVFDSLHRAAEAMVLQEAQGAVILAAGRGDRHSFGAGALLKSRAGHATNLLRKAKKGQA
jgi:hypothetical protein